MTTSTTHFRASARYTLDHRISVRISDSLERPATLENVGFGGARVALDDAPHVGTVVRLRIGTATAWEPITLDGIVRWSEGDPGERGRMGIELAPLDAATALALDAWLATLGYDAAPSSAHSR